MKYNKAVGIKDHQLNNSWIKITFLHILNSNIITEFSKKQYGEILQKLKT